MSSSLDPTTPGAARPPEWIGVLGALDEELAPLLDAPGAAPRTSPGPAARLGVPCIELVRGGARLLIVRCGVGKVAAGRAAAALLAEGVEGLLVVGTCGGLSPRVPVGTLVHAVSAVQWDLSVRDGRESQADARWRATWQAVAPGVEARMLTADRPALGVVDRLRRARAAGGPAVADMETAAVGAVAGRAGVPWAALRAVTDTVGLRRARSFHANLGEQAGRAAATVPRLVEALRR